MPRLSKELWLVRGLAFSKHCNSNSQALNAFENVCTKTGARPFSRAVGFGHLSLSSSENPSLKVYTQKPYIQWNFNSCNRKIETTIFPFWLHCVVSRTTQVAALMQLCPRYALLASVVPVKYWHLKGSGEHVPDDNPWSSKGPVTYQCPWAPLAHICGHKPALRKQISLAICFYSLFKQAFWINISNLLTQQDWQNKW